MRPTANPLRAILTAPLARAIVATFLALTTAFAIAASPVDDGRAAYAAGDYKAAIGHWQSLIDEGRPEGHYFMAVMYAEGKGVAQDHAKAFALYTIAAEKDYVSAQYNLANQYANGEGVQQDFSKAEYWWTKAADNGLLPAQVNLGHLYYHGALGQKDPAQARKWLTLAIEKGSVNARDTLAKLDAEEGVVRPAAAAPPAPSEPSASDTPLGGTGDGLRREAWVLAQPENHYTIQVLAAGTDTLARDFIQQQGLASRAAYIESTAQGNAVFRVIYGSYASRDLAEKTLATLPRSLLASGPWVRSFADIRKLVDRRFEARGAP